jgi:membrane metallo-endopeptidase-like protein 1
MRNREMQFEKSISGQESFEERWEECVNTVLAYLPIATSALYVKNFFKKESRDAAWDIVNSIRDEFESTLNDTEWMDDETKAKAWEKAKKMVMHIGYPDELTDDKKVEKYYKGLEVDEKNFFGSVLNITKFDIKKVVRSLRKPVNKTSWEEHANVAVINAFYNPVENSIQVPAGILQGIYFSADRPKYMNYAAIGSIIGHEVRLMMF